MTYRLLKDISKKDIKKTLKLRGKVTTIKQTSGPTLMVLNDGTSNFTFKAFVKPGIRAYPEIKIDDFASVEGEITERNGGIEAEVKTMRKLSNIEQEELKESIKKLQEGKLLPDTTEFTIKSKGLEALKPRFIKVTKIIKKAILDGRPILLRHNADTDGYSSAITIERAILKTMDEMTGNDLQYKYNFYKRAPSKAPFYEYEDSVKDLANWLKDKVKNNAKPPLIIITDNGSTEEDILSIKQMKIYDATIVVIDHHYPGEIKNGKVKVDEYIDGHINPYLEGYDSNICAGMLGYELANFINKKNENSVFIPAMAAILDHTEGPEREEYLKHAKEKNFTEEYLSELGEIVDMQSHFLRFMEAREFVDDLFGNNMENQKKIVSMLKPELKKRYEMVEKVAEKYAKIKDFGKFYLISFDGEKATFRGDYPQIGKTTNHIHKTFEKKQDKPIITMTHGSTFMTIRVSDEITNFAVPEFVQKVFKELPYINANGGGHEHAGSVRFIEYAKEEVIKLFDKYLIEVNSKQK